MTQTAEWNQLEIMYWTYLFNILVTELKIR